MDFFTLVNNPYVDQQQDDRPMLDYYQSYLDNKSWMKRVTNLSLSQGTTDDQAHMLGNTLQSQDFENVQQIGLMPSSHSKQSKQTHGISTSSPSKKPDLETLIVPYVIQ